MYIDRHADTRASCTASGSPVSFSDGSPRPTCASTATRWPRTPTTVTPVTRRDRTSEGRLLAFGYAVETGWRRVLEAIRSRLGLRPRLPLLREEEVGREPPVHRRSSGCLHLRRVCRAVRRGPGRGARVLDATAHGRVTPVTLRERTWRPTRLGTPVRRAGRRLHTSELRWDLCPGRDRTWDEPIW
jgi:hypothetical protein